MKKMMMVLAMVMAPFVLAAESTETNPRLDNGTNLFERGATSKKPFLRVIGVDAANNTGNGMTVNCPSCPGGSGSSGYIGVSIVAQGQAITVTFGGTAQPVGLTGAAYAGVTAGSGVLQNSDDIEGVLKGATSTSAPFFTKPIGVDGSNAASATNGVPVNVVGSMTYGRVSSPAYTVLTGTATTVNLTSAAGIDQALDLAVRVNYGANAAVRFVVNYSATAPSDICAKVGHYAASTATTQVLGRWKGGSHCHMCSDGTGPTGNYVSLDILGYVTQTATP